MIPWVRDAVERVAATYVQSVIGLLTADQLTSMDMSTVKTLLVSGLPAVLALVKAWLARWVGDADSASLLPDVKVSLEPRC